MTQTPTPPRRRGRPPGQPATATEAAAAAPNAKGSDTPYQDPRLSVRPSDPISGRNVDDNALASSATLASLVAQASDYELAEVNLERIIWDAYCREPRAANLNRLRNNWLPEALGTIYVSKRDGGVFAGIEGRHRYTVAKEKGMEYLPARIYHNLSYEQEAALYNLFNRYSPHSAMDRLQGRVEAKEPKALSMTAMVREIGLDWDFDRRGLKSHIKSVATIEAALDTWGPDVLRDALHLLHDAWGTDEKAYQEDSVGGVVQFLARYGGYPFSLSEPKGGYNRARMLALMRERGLRQFKSEAVQISLAEHLYRSHSFGRAMRSIYNLHLRNGQLPTWPDRFYSEAGRASQSASARRVTADLPADERRARVKRGWATRRANEEATTPANGTE